MAQLNFYIAYMLIVGSVASGLITKAIELILQSIGISPQATGTLARPMAWLIIALALGIYTWRRGPRKVRAENHLSYTLGHLFLAGGNVLATMVLLTFVFPDAFGLITNQSAGNGLGAIAPWIFWAICGALFFLAFGSIFIRRCKDSNPLVTLKH